MEIENQGDLMKVHCLGKTVVEQKQKTRHDMLIKWETNKLLKIVKKGLYYKILLPMQFVNAVYLHYLHTFIK